jgi:hypothetical protein
MLRSNLNEQPDPTRRSKYLARYKFSIEEEYQRSHYFTAD